MKRLFFVVVFLFQTAVFAHARTVEEYLGEASNLLANQKYSEAYDLLFKGYQEHEGDIELVFALARTKHLMGDYENAVENYLNLLKGIEVDGYEAPADFHDGLVDAYNEIGQKHYFSKELCLRIIYHLERVLALKPELKGSKTHLEFLRKTLGHYDIADTGAKMLESGGDGMDFSLPNDGINQEKKIEYLEKAREQVSNFEINQRTALYPTVESNRTVEDIVRVFEEKAQEMSPIRFRLKRESGLPDRIISYEHPDKLKIETPDLDEMSVFQGQNGIRVDKKERKILESGMLENKLDSAKAKFIEGGLLLPNWDWLLRTYNFKIERFKGIPEFLKDFYVKQSSENLYLLTGAVKGESPVYPPIVKVEFIVDLDLKIAVCTRVYWQGILGSGEQEVLASMDVVKAVQKVGNLTLLQKGATVTYVEELKDSNENWSVEVMSVAEAFSDDEFNVDRFRR